MKNKKEVDKSSFIYQLREYGLKKIVLSFDFVASLVLFVILLTSYLNSSDWFKPVGADSATGILTILSAIFAILIASIAIILSFSGEEFVKFLRDHGQLHKILFNFWWCCATYLVIILITFAKFVVNIHPGHWLSSIYSSLVFSGFVYALLQTLYVVATVMRFAHFLDFYDRALTKDKK